jgi:hypothetical protein
LSIDNCVRFFRAPLQNNIQLRGHQSAGEDRTTLAIGCWCCPSVRAAAGAGSSAEETWGCGSADNLAMLADNAIAIPPGIAAGAAAGACSAGVREKAASALCRILPITLATGHDRFACGFIHSTEVTG